MLTARQYETEPGDAKVSRVLCDVWRRWVHDESGSANWEYGVLLGAVAVAGLLTVWILRVQMDGTYAQMLP
jgi:Flp pilus assembly pilin Flp